MKMNKGKIKVHVCGDKNWTQLTLYDYSPLEKVNDYRYLGRQTRQNGRSTKEITSRINPVKCAFRGKTNIYLSINIDMKMIKITSH